MRYELAFVVVTVTVISVTAWAQIRVNTPRIQPVEAVGAAAESSASGLPDTFSAFGVDANSATSLIRTLARHPAAAAGIGPLAVYVRERAMATVVDQTLLALRVAWLTRSDAMWAEQAEKARVFGLQDEDLRRVAEGREAEWGRWDSTILRAADELYRDSFLSQETWAALGQVYNARQIVDVLFTVAEHTMLAMMANSFGVQPDGRFADRRPTDVLRRMELTRATPLRLEIPRIVPVPVEERTEAERALLDPDGTGQPPINLFATLVRFPALYRSRAVQSTYIRTGSTLSGRVREMLILRIGWLCGAEYEWAQHAPIAREEGLTDDEVRNVSVGPDASGWSPIDAALLRATDELYRDDTISDATWATLAESYGEHELIDIVITVAGYRMVSMVLNTLGVQREPDTETFPDVERR